MEAGEASARTTRWDFDDCPFGRKPQAHHALHADRLRYWPFAPQRREGQASATEAASRLRPACNGSPLKERKMSVIAHRKNVDVPAAAGRADRAAIASLVPATISFLRKAIGSGTRLLLHVVEVMAEARLQRAAIEA